MHLADVCENLSLQGFLTSTCVKALQSYANVDSIMIEGCHQVSGGEMMLVWPKLSWPVVMETTQWHCLKILSVQHLPDSDMIADQADSIHDE